MREAIIVISNAALGAWNIGIATHSLNVGIGVFCLMISLLITIKSLNQGR